MCSWKNRKFLKEKVFNQAVGMAATGVFLDTFRTDAKSGGSGAVTANASVAGDGVGTAISRSGSAGEKDSANFYMGMRTPRKEQAQKTSGSASKKASPKRDGGFAHSTTL